MLEIVLLGCFSCIMFCTGSPGGFLQRGHCGSFDMGVTGGCLHLQVHSVSLEDSYNITLVICCPWSSLLFLGALSHCGSGWEVGLHSTNGGWLVKAARWECAPPLFLLCLFQCVVGCLGGGGSGVT